MIIGSDANCLQKALLRAPGGSNNGLRLCKSYITYDSIFAGKRQRAEEQTLKLTEDVKRNGVTELLKFNKVNKGL